MRERCERRGRELVSIDRWWNNGHKRAVGRHARDTQRMRVEDITGNKTPLRCRAKGEGIPGIVSSDNCPVSVNDCECESYRHLCGKVVHSVVDVPLNVIDATRGRVGELVKRMRREVEITVGTPLTPVRQRDGDGLALVCN